MIYQENIDRARAVLATLQRGADRRGLSLSHDYRAQLALQIIAHATLALSQNETRTKACGLTNLD